MAGFRDIGVQVGQYLSDLRKPDGTSIRTDLVGAATSTVGAAVRSTGITGATAMAKIENGQSFQYVKPGTSQMGKGLDLPNRKFNPLEQFASYTPLWTLACLEPKQFNDPRSYRDSPSNLKHVVFASGGRFDKQRVTIEGPQAGGQVPEYFVNNFQMNCIIAANDKTGNSNAIKFSFDIYEPYSMGLLLQSLQVAAKKAKYTNYLQNAPYVLRLDFMGYDENGQQYKSVKPKFFTMKLVSVKFSVTESGSMYKVEGIPYNHHGFSDAVNVAYNDVKIEASKTVPTDAKFPAGSVGDLLVTGENSLCAFLNKNEEKLKQEGKVTYPDIYEIQFPENASDFNTEQPKDTTPKTATVNPYAPPPRVLVQGGGAVAPTPPVITKNEVGASMITYLNTQGGNFKFAKNEVRDEKTGKIVRDSMVVDPKSRAFQFAQGQSLTAIINQVILSSDYAKRAIDPANKIEGFIKWFKLDVQIQLQADKFDDLIGDYPMKIIYRVVPFMVHESIFQTPNSVSIGYHELKKKIVKAYEYIYTGNNVDIIKFDININNLFFTGSDASAAAKSGLVAAPDNQGPGGNNPQKAVKTGKGDASKEAQTANTGRSRPRRSQDSLATTKGGDQTTSPEREVAKTFHKAVITGSSADMITIDLEILGDPYYMVDSGISNYFAKPLDSDGKGVSLETEDGTMNYEGNDVYIFLTFKTPVDINENTGLYDISARESESPFGGIYRVTMCENTFNDGVFKQKLKCLRSPAQDKDFDGDVLTQDKAESNAVKVGEALRDANSPQDSPVDSEQKQLLRAAKSAVASGDNAAAAEALGRIRQNRGVA
jgi:hypothetical protein